MVMIQAHYFVDGYLEMQRVEKCISNELSIKLY